MADLLDTNSNGTVTYRSTPNQTPAQTSAPVFPVSTVNPATQNLGVQALSGTPAGGGAGAGQGGGVPGTVGGWQPSAGAKIPTTAPTAAAAQREDTVAFKPETAQVSTTADAGSAALVAPTAGTQARTDQGAFSAVTPLVSEEDRTYAETWQRFFPGVSPEDISRVFFTTDANGNKVPNIPEIVKNGYADQLVPMIMGKLTGFDALYQSFATEGANALARNWRDSWKSLQENAANLGIGSDGLGILMMIRGKSDLLEKIGTYGADLMAKKGELDSEAVKWALELLKYGQDATDSENKLKFDYWSGITAGIREAMRIGADAWTTLQNLGFDRYQADLLHSEFSSRYGLDAFDKILSAAENGLIPADIVKSMLGLAAAGDWQGVASMYSQVKDTVDGLGKYKSLEDASSIMELYDRSGYIYDVIPKGNDTFDIRVLYQEVVNADGSVSRGIAKSTDNIQLNRLISSNPGKVIESVYNAETNTVTYKVTDQDVQPGTKMVLDPHGLVKYVKDAATTGTGTEPVTWPTGTSRDSYESVPVADYTKWRADFITKSGTLNVDDEDALKFFAQNGSKDAAADLAYVYTLTNRPGASDDASKSLALSYTNGLSLPPEQRDVVYNNILRVWGVGQPATGQTADIAARISTLSDTLKRTPTDITSAQEYAKLLEGRGVDINTINSQDDGNGYTNPSAIITWASEGAVGSTTRKTGGHHIVVIFDKWIADVVANSGITDANLKSALISGLKANLDYDTYYKWWQGIA